jgi:hypothetical protein
LITSDITGELSAFLVGGLIGLMLTFELFKKIVSKWYLILLNAYNEPEKFQYVLNEMKKFRKGE